MGSWDVIGLPLLRRDIGNEDRRRHRNSGELWEGFTGITETYAENFAKATSRIPTESTKTFSSREYPHLAK